MYGHLNSSELYFIYKFKLCNKTPTTIPHWSLRVGVKWMKNSIENKDILSLHFFMKSTITKFPNSQKHKPTFVFTEETLDFHYKSFFAM